ncbi:major facilitator superfamily domain-containing protein [Mycena rosella]|uniref:Major facilitator superfamily domain-containing protein n=1 Tax=Mycena rosella TaxID=1033263 RepID=A0AAD7H1X6_MYCRO|nr:major facilitator superfamily domain-containing protein [Mycena rosella]
MRGMTPKLREPPVASQWIYPYINQLDIVAGDENVEKKESLFFMTEALTVLRWSRASDRFGHKPILLIGLFGTSVSMLCFGLSRTFWALVASRCLTGLLNGNIGDMRDPSNRAQGFAYIPVVWDAGAALRPLVGGFLARPPDHFPRLFGGTFWKEFPYFLPCLATGGFVFIAFVVTLALFKETIPRKNGTSRVKADASGVDVLETEAVPPPRRGLLPGRELLTFPVLISISNYVTFAFLYIISALLPLFLAMSIEIGGPGLQPAKIGLILSAYSAATALFQVLFCAKLIQRFGFTRVFIARISTCFPLFTLFPIMSIVGKRTGLTPVLDPPRMRPRAGSRGTVNGLAQTAVSSAKAFGPAMATSLFSLSVEKNY